MKEKIDETLKKLAAATPTGKPTEPAEYSQAHDLPGDPQCPICHGVGYIRQDLPVGHPDFGRLQICSCRHGQISQQIHRKLFALSNLDELKHLTFDNFKPRGYVGLREVQAESLERAYNQARQFSQTLTGWLILQGKYGCGKTHLAAAIGNFAVDMGVPTLFITVPDLLDSLRFAYDNPETTFEERFEEIRNAPLLVLDDFGTQNATPWAQEKLFQIINYRYINHLPMVVTTNLMLDELEDRVQSRFLDPEMVTRAHIQAPDYRRPTHDSKAPGYSYLDLLADKTFASFDLRSSEGLPAEQTRSLEKAFEAARQFAENPAGWLVLTGPYGCGKTHLAAAIANFHADQGKSTIFVVVPDLFDHLRSTFGPKSTVSLDYRFEEIRTAPVLILDDMGTQNVTPWVREKLYQLFNYRYDAELPTVITTIEFREEMDARILSRMMDTRLCKICPITAPSYRGVQRSRPRRSKTKT